MTNIKELINIKDSFNGYQVGKNGVIKINLVRTYFWNRIEAYEVFYDDNTVTRIPTNLRWEETWKSK